MTSLITRRLLSLIPLLLLVSFGVFLLVALVPGDAAVTIAGGTNATPERVAEVRSELHLDEPLVSQYGRWLGDAVQGDLGTSLYSHVSVAREIGDRLPPTPRPGVRRARRRPGHRRTDRASGRRGVPGTGVDQRRATRHERRAARFPATGSPSS